MNKKDLLRMMNCLDFSIADIDVKDGKEMVKKEFPAGDGEIWWEMEKEGSGFKNLFKGSIFKVCV